MLENPSDSSSDVDMESHQPKSFEENEAEYNANELEINSFYTQFRDLLSEYDDRVVKEPPKPPGLKTVKSKRVQKDPVKLKKKAKKSKSKSEALKDATTKKLSFTKQTKSGLVRVPMMAPPSLSPKTSTSSSRSNLKKSSLSLSSERLKQGLTKARKKSQSQLSLNGQEKEEELPFDQDLLARLKATTGSIPYIYSEDFYDKDQTHSSHPTIWRDISRPQSAIHRKLESRSFRPLSARSLSHAPQSKYKREFSGSSASVLQSDKQSGFATTFQHQFDHLQDMQEQMEWEHSKSIRPELKPIEGPVTQKPPLEWFDNPEFDSFSVLEHIHIGKIQNGKGAKAVSRYFAYPENELEWTWEPCYVLEYDAKKDDYLIEWVETKQEKTVKRLNLLFDGEEKQVFFDRLEYAVKMRSEAERNDVYWKRVLDRVPASTVSRMPSTVKKSILNKFHPRWKHKYKHIFDECLIELDEEYNLSMRKATFDILEGSTFFETLSSASSEKFAREAVEKANMKENEMRSELQRQVAAGTKDLSLYLFSANAKIQRSIIDILGILPRLLDPHFGQWLSKDVTFPCSFQDFCHRTRLNGHILLSRLKNDWTMEIVKIIETSLGDFFNLNETLMAAYKKSRLHDFLQLINMIMETQLKAVVKKEMLNVLQLMHVNPFTQTLSEDATLLIPKLFVVSIIISPDGKAKLDPSVESIQTELLSLFQWPIKLTRNSIPHIETAVLRNIFKVGDHKWVGTLEDVSLMESGCHAIKQMMQRVWQPFHDQVALYRRFEFFMKENLENTPLNDMDVDIAAFREPMAKYCLALTNIRQVTMDEIDIQPFILDCKPIKLKLVQTCSRLLDEVVEKIIHLMTTICHFLIESYEEFFEKMLIDPGTDAGLWKELWKSIVQCNEEQENYMLQVDDIRLMWDLMYENSVSINNTISEIYWRTCAWPPKLEDEVKRATKRLHESRKQILSQITLDRNHVITCVTAYISEIEQFEGITSLSKSALVYESVQSLRERINKIFSLIALIVEREELVGEAKFEIPMADYLHQNFVNYENLWQTVTDMNETMDNWMDSYFMDIRSEHVIEKMDHWRSTFKKILPYFSLGKPNSEAILLKSKSKLDDFSRYTNVLLSLLNPALREKHWGQISNIVGISLQDVQALKLRDVMELDLELVQDIVGDISQEASSDFILESKLDGLKQELSTYDFITHTHDSDIEVVDNIRDCMVVFEDQLIKLERYLTETRSPTLVARVKNWSSRLYKSQETLEMWDYLQALFVDVYPITNLPNFEQNLNADDLENYESMRKLMGILSDFIVKNKKFVSIVLRSDLHDLLSSAQTRVERLVMTSTHALDVLRAKFNRFYFLTSTEIIQVLGGIPDSKPTKFYSHLPKLFDNVYGLFKAPPKVSTTENKIPILQPIVSNPDGQEDDVLNEVVVMHNRRRRSSRTQMIARRQYRKNKVIKRVEEDVVVVDDYGSIHGFSSFEGEKITLNTPIKVTPRVDEWIGLLEKQMKESLRSLCFEQIDQTSELDDIIQKTGYVAFQATYVSLYVFFCQQVATILSEEDDLVWRDVRKQLIKGLDLLSHRIKFSTTLNCKSSVENTIAILSHFLDVGDDIFSLGDGNLAANHMWTHQLRYTVEDNQIIARYANYSINYGFEYAGNSQRLLISPTIHKHLPYITDSMYYSRSCAIIGQDVYEKVDMFMELAKWFGRKVYCVNYAENASEACFSNIMCGAMTLGAWLVIENCNFLSYQRMSILAQQINILQRSLITSKTRQAPVVFEGKEILPNPACSIFLSVNGSSIEWERNYPANLRSLFRPIALLLPDLALVSEINLKAKGHSFAGKLTRKLMAVLRHITPMIENATKMDISMKILDQILRCVGSLVRGESDYSTEALKLAIAIEKTLCPLLIPRDIPYLRSILYDVFGFAHPSLDFKAHSFYTVVQSACKTMELSAHDAFTLKVVEMYDACLANQTIAIVGKSMTGKSTMTRCMVQAINSKWLKDDALKIFRFTSNLVRYSDEVFGSTRNNTWDDGILTRLVRAANQHNETLVKKMDASEVKATDFYSCIVIDGRLESRFLEKLLCGPERNVVIHLETGESILVSPRSRVIFETEALHFWSPTEIGRCNIVYVPESSIKSTQIFNNLLNDFPAVLKKHSTFYMHLHQLVFTSISNFVKANCHSNLVLSESINTINICKMIVSLYTDMGEEGYERLMDFEQYYWILATFLFSVIWVVGALTDYQERVGLSNFIQNVVCTKVVRELEKKMNLSTTLLAPCVQFPSVDTVYEYFFDDKILSWEPWCVVGCPVENIVENRIVRTDDIIRLTYFSRILYSQNIPILVSGKRGVGKTTTTFQSMYNSDEIHEIPIRICLNEQIKGFNFSEEVEKVLVRKRHRAYGLLGDKNLIAIVDDLNVDCFPRYLEQFEIWRSLADNKGWYIKRQMTTIENLKLAIVLNHSQRVDLGTKYDRFLRFFWNFAIADDIDQKAITICRSWIYESTIASLLTINGFGIKLIQASNFLNAKMGKIFRRTPTSPHFIFSLREITNSIRPLIFEKTNESMILLQCWTYNCIRVYGDRLTTPAEHEKFDNLIQDTIKNHFEVDLSSVFPPEKPLMTKGFGRGLIPAHKNPDCFDGTCFKSFKETLQVLAKNMMMIVEKQSLNYAQSEQILHKDGLITAMKIENAIKVNHHVCLMGHDYEDRSLITRLTCLLSNYTFYQLNSFAGSLDPTNEWKEFLKTIFIKGLETWKPVVVFIRMDDIEKDYQWDDIVNIIQFGWVRDLSSRIITSDISETAKQNLKTKGFPLSSLTEQVLLTLCCTERFLRLVISVDGNVTPKKWWYIKNRHPWLAHSTSIIWIDKWGPESVAYFADTLIKSNFIPGNVSWFHEFLYFVFEYAEKLSQMEHRISGKRYICQKSVAKTIMSIFSSLYVLKTNDVDKKISKLNSSLASIKKLFAANVKIQSDYQSWSNQVRDMTLKCEACVKQIEVERGVKDRIMVEVQVNEEQRNRLLEEKKSLEALYSLELDKVAPAVNNAIKGVDAIKKNDLYEIKSLINPPKSVLMVMEVLCLIFKIDIKPGETVWENAKKLVAETKFVQNLINFDKDTLNAQMMHKVAVFTQSPEFSSREVHTISKAIGALAAWILALERYYEAVASLEPKKRQIQDVLNKIEAAELEIRKSRTKKQGIEENMSQLKTNLDVLIRQKDIVQRTFKEWEAKSKFSLSMIEVLTNAESRWLKQLADAKNQKVCLLADTILISAQISYFGPYSKQVRDSIKAEWIDWLNTHNVSYIKEQTGVSEFNAKIPDIFHSSDILKDIHSLDNYFIAKYHDKIPVLCDPSESFYSFVMALETSADPKIIKTESPKWRETISTAMRKGGVVLLLTDFQEPDVYLQNLIREYHWFVCNKTKTLHDFDGENVELHKSFKLYIFLNRTFKAVPEKWLRYTAPVRCTIEHEAVSTILQDILLSVCAPKYREQLNHAEVDRMNRTNRLLALENRGLEISALLTEVDLVGGDSYRQLKDVEEQIAVTQGHIASSKKTEKETDAQLYWYSNFANFAGKLFTVVDRMGKICPLYATSLSQFISIFKTTIMDVTLPNKPVPLESLPKLLIRHVYDAYVLGFSRPDLILFTFMLAIEYNAYNDRRESLQISPTLWHFFLNGQIHKQVKFPKKWHVDEFPNNPSPQYLRKINWEKIVTLSKHPEFLKFAMEYVRYANKATTPPTEANWEDVFRSMDPCQAKFPTRWDAELKKFEKILVIQCIRPDAISKSIEDFITVSIGKEFLEPVPDLITVALRRSTPSMPLLMVYTTHDDPIRHIKWFATRKNMGNNISIIDVGHVTEDYIMNMMDESSKRGRWLVLQNCELHPMKISAIEKKLRSHQQDHRQLHTSYRLWLITKPFFKFSPFVYIHSVKFLFEPPQLLGRILEGIVPILEENLSPHEIKSSTLYKEYLLKLIIFFVCLQSRRGYTTCSSVADHELALSDLQVAFKQLRSCFNFFGNSADKLIPKRALTLFGETAFISKAADAWDRRLLSTLFTDIMNYDWEEEEEFHSNDLPFKQILECMNRNDMASLYESLKGFMKVANPHIFGMNENALTVTKRAESRTLMRGLALFESHILVAPPIDIWSDQETLMTMIHQTRERINAIVKHSILEHQYKSNIVTGGNIFELYDSNSSQKHVDRVLLDNIARYRSMAKVVIFNLSTLIDAWNGKLTFTTRLEVMAKEIYKNQIPAAWVRETSFYFTKYGFKEWSENFCSRLSFIKEWYFARYENTTAVFKGLPMYDLGLLFYPSSFLQAILLDYAAVNKESIENLDFETMILSSKQLNPPERGVYLSGMYLSNASWDFSHNMLKDSKTQEQYTFIPCLWLQPVVRYDADKGGDNKTGMAGGNTGAKQQAASLVKRNWQKFKCPIFRFRPATSSTEYKLTDLTEAEENRLDKVIGEEDSPLLLSDLNLSPHSYQSLHVGHVELTTDVPVKFWVKRNVSLVLEIVGFKGTWGKA